MDNANIVNNTSKPFGYWNDKDKCLAYWQFSHGSSMGNEVLKGEKKKKIEEINKN